jgi:hypothetical protein
MGQALFVAKDIGVEYPAIGFRKGTCEYRSRLTGKRYVVEPDMSGYLVSSDNLLIYTDSPDRGEAMRLIELADNAGGMRELINTE